VSTETVPKDEAVNVSFLVFSVRFDILDGYPSLRSRTS